MQRYLLASLFLLALGAYLSYGNSAGPGAVQMKDRTGSPLAEGFCQACHTAGAFNPSMSVELLNEDFMSVDQYVPNEPYTLRITINADASAARYGFQATALHSDDDLRAGTFGSIPTTQVTVLNEREYPEHSQPSTTNTWDIPWTAPSVDVGDIRFYAAGVATNDNGTSGGDGATRLVEPFVVTNALSSSNEPLHLAQAMQAIPNPVQQQTQLHIIMADGAFAQMYVYDATGRVVQQRSVELLTGENQLDLDMTALPAGHYRVVIDDGRAQSALPLIKT